MKRVIGNEATAWRRAYRRLLQPSADSVSRDLSHMSLAVKSEGADVQDYIDERGRSKKLDLNAAEYRETSTGEIVLSKNFMNLKSRISATKGIEPYTNDVWADGSFTTLRAPRFPIDPVVGFLSNGATVPPTCVDWQQIEENVRDEEDHVVVDKHI